jgi:hypothetical protein
MHEWIIMTGLNLTEKPGTIRETGFTRLEFLDDGESVMKE